MGDCSLRIRVHTIGASRNGRQFLKDNQPMCLCVVVITAENFGSRGWWFKYKSTRKIIEV